MKFRVRQPLFEVPRLRELQRARLGAFLVFAVVACSDTTAPKQFVSITPVSESVALQTLGEGKVLRTSVILTNTSDAPVGWTYCGFTLEKNVSGFTLADGGPSYPWVTVAAPLCAAAPGTVPVQPGASVTIPVEVLVRQTGSESFDGSPGEYRVHLLLATQILFQAYITVPHDLSVSNPFNIVTQ